MDKKVLKLVKQAQEAGYKFYQGEDGNYCFSFPWGTWDKYVLYSENKQMYLKKIPRPLLPDHPDDLLPVKVNNFEDFELWWEWWEYVECLKDY